MLKLVGLTHNPKRPETVELASEIAAGLAEWGVAVQRCETWDTPSMEAMAPHLGVLVVLGGDGSTLRAARAAAPFRLPVVTVNMGRVGFLAEMQPSEWRELLPRIMRGEYWVEERLMLSATAFRDGRTLGTLEALNDVVISHGTLARVVRLDTKIDGTRLTTYACDGLIVATPTGSTAYSLAAGGPIMPPGLRCMSLVPIAPHLSLEKPLVLSDDALVEVTVSTDHQAILTADGQDELPLRDGDRVIVRAGAHVARFARLRARSYFYEMLMPRLTGC